MLDLCLLGTAGTIPLPRRRLSETLVRVGGSLMLLDCAWYGRWRDRDRDT